MMPLGDRVWVLLNHLSADFASAGPGRIVGVDPATDEVVSTVTLTGLENCASAALAIGGEGLWVGCSGLLSAGESGQMATSGLVFLTHTDGQLAEQWRVSTEDGLGGAVAWSITSLSPEVAVFTVFGSLAEGTSDRLLWADRAKGTVEELGVSASAFELGDVLWSPEERMLLLADATPEAPAIRRFTVGDAELTELEPIDSSPGTGLPPRHLTFFR
jgi:hypothetical protein